MRRYLMPVLSGLTLTVGMITASALPAAAAGVVRPDIDCTQNPGANSANTAHFTGSGVNIRTGPATSCTAVGEGFPANKVTAHCEKNVSGTEWIYLTDNTTGKKGWSTSNFVTWSGGIDLC